MGCTVRSSLDLTLSAAAGWLTEEDEALVGALRATADALDRSYSDRTMKEFREAERDLLARKSKRLSERPLLEQINRLHSLL